MKYLITIALWLPSITLAQFSDYKVGKGAEYHMKLETGEAKVSIAVVKNENNKIVIEMYMSALNTFIPVNVWQQFHLYQASSNSLAVSDGYIYSSQIKQPQKLTSEYLTGYSDGAQLKDFLFSDRNKFDKNKIGDEEVNISAGKTKAQHYQINSNGQTIDFWISDEAKPIGLVKLESKGPLPKHNYKMQLTKLLSGVGAKINPKEAIPLNDLGRSFLPKAGPNMLMH